jgi:hypothetical protein
VFDGVVVLKRAHPPNKRVELEEAVTATHPDPEADADAEGDVDGEAEEIVAPDHGHVELNGLIGVAGEDDHYNSNQGDSSVP